MIFNYEAMDQSGQDVRDTIEAETSEDALSKIRNLGYFPTRIRSQGGQSLMPESVPDVEVSPALRHVVNWAPVVLLVICVACLFVPLSYGWNHDELSTLQVIKANWKSSLTAGVIFCVLSLWVRLRKWAENGCK